jgi:hypothetical protein
MLRIAAYLQFFLAIGHILVMPWLEEAFKLYGIDKVMNQIAAYGAFWPYLLTIAIASCFVLCGLYALSACRCIRRLPLLWYVIFFIAAIFCIRAMIGVYWMVSTLRCDVPQLSAAIISGFIGLLYLIGGIKQLKF